jgi:hypothetical protein
MLSTKCIPSKRKKNIRINTCCRWMMVKQTRALGIAYPSYVAPSPQPLPVLTPPRPRSLASASLAAFALAASLFASASSSFSFSSSVSSTSMTLFLCVFSCPPFEKHVTPQSVAAHAASFRYVALIWSPSEIACCCSFFCVSFLASPLAWLFALVRRGCPRGWVVGGIPCPVRGSACCCGSFAFRGGMASGTHSLPRCLHSEGKRQVPPEFRRISRIFSLKIVCFCTRVRAVYWNSMRHEILIPLRPQPGFFLLICLCDGMEVPWVNQGNCRNTMLAIRVGDVWMSVSEIDAKTKHSREVFLVGSPSPVASTSL